MAEEKKGLAGNGAAGNWHLCVDEGLKTGSHELVIDYLPPEGAKMFLPMDRQQVQIPLKGDAGQQIQDLITALEQAKADLIEPEEEKEEEFEGEGIRLFYLEHDGERIPVITDNPAWIRSDVGGEDHGGMDWEVFSKVCCDGEIKQVKGEADLPPDLMDAYCYGGGSVGGFVDATCRQLCEMMDDGIIALEKL
jgi:hypothetical protein